MLTIERNEAFVGLFHLNLLQSPLLELHFLAYLAGSLANWPHFYFKVVGE